MTCKAPAFSVVIPVYNAAATIEATVASVLAQDCRDFEIVLVDDGSTDESLSVLRALACRHDCIRFVSQANSGVSAARNLGASLARGTFLAFLDADDTWEADKLSAHAELHAAGPGIDASFGRIAFCEAQPGKRLVPQVFSTVTAGANALDSVIAENPVCSSSNLVVRRTAFEAMGGFREGMHHAEDQEFIARLVAAGHALHGIDRHLVNYRMSADGLSANLAAMHDGWRALAAPYAAQVDLRAAEAVYCRYLARRALRTGGPAREALGYAAMGLRSDAARFLADRRRGVLTLVSAVAALAMPGGLRRRVFA